MKKWIFLISLFSVLGLFYACSARYVAAKPTHTEYARPNRPSQHHTWIEGSWSWNNAAKKYSHQNGYWKLNKHNHQYSPGHWDNSPRGYRWVNGKRNKK